MVKRIIIMGAAGRDFHNFNMLYKDNPEYKVVAFTASQIPYISDRIYPAELAGKLYPKGIPIFSEDRIEELIKELKVDEVVLSYSDLLYEEVMHKASRVLATGADFKLINPYATMLKSSKIVISVCAARTGSGKSTVSRKVASILRSKGIKFVVVRHPMPYGDLKRQVVQKFTCLEDLDKYECTIEEREEYEPHINDGNIVFAGVDYKRILEEAEKEADVIIWDGGNNDLPFFYPDLHIVVIDPLRVGHELTSYPGEVNVRIADVIVINKVDVASPEDVKKTEENVKAINKKAIIIKAKSEVFVSNPDIIRGKRVLVVEDGPSVTHGHLGFGAGYVAAKKYGAKEIVDPRPYAVGSIRQAYEEYKHIGPILPAVGYSKEQIRDLVETINNTPAEVVVLGTPANLAMFAKINKPMIRVNYYLEEISKPTLSNVINKFLKERLLQ
ncbi:MAG: GTPase [Thermofilum sp. ex4484_79]|nr:MAG: GTPase [Thermofilum sp. ex4484_79]